MAVRLRSVCVGLREDLDVSRHVFQGRPAYVIHDPITLTNHRFDLSDYDVCIRLRPERMLGDVFEELVAEKKAERKDEESFYRFVLSLHRSGVLRLPISDDKLIYRRYLAKKKAARKRRATAFLFFQIPLWNPDRFLTRNMGWARPLFSRAFFAAWTCLMMTAGWMLLNRWDEFWRPANGLFLLANLPLLWVTLIVLKGFHEFGHAFACKHFRLYVPEMGVYLIAGTPCAYVDATASWMLPNRWKRILICLAGMYVESIIAAIAVFVWCATPPSLLNSAAHRVVLLAGGVTVLFNINPLLRYDGYYIFSDLVNIPNLRSRSTDYVIAKVKQLFLGIRPSARYAGGWVRLVLLGYGLLSPLYRVSVMVAIAALISTRLAWLGLFLGLFILGGAFMRLVLGVVRYLWFSPETSHVRGRSVAMSVLLLAGVPAVVWFFPVPNRGVVAPASIRAERQKVVRAETPGFVEEVLAEDGAWLNEGDPVAKLKNEGLADAAGASRSALDLARTRLDAARLVDPAAVRRREEEAEREAARVKRIDEQQAALTLTAALEGRFAERLSPRDVGRFVRSGEELGLIYSGAWQAECLLNARQMAAVRPHEGMTVEFRPTCAPWRSRRGVVTRIHPIGESQVDQEGLTHKAGGDIAVVDAAGHATEPYFKVVLTFFAEENSAETILPDAANREHRPAGAGMGAVPSTRELLRPGLTGRVLFSAPNQTLGAQMKRTFLGFLDRVRQN